MNVISMKRIDRSTLEVATALPDVLKPRKAVRGPWGVIAEHPAITIGVGLLMLMGLVALLAPYLGTIDPTELAMFKRTRAPSLANWFGTDMLGRDVYSRVLYGTRVSLVVGFAVAFLASLGGMVIGLVSGAVRWADGLIMRAIDGMMSIPPILLAVALMALTRGSVKNVVIEVSCFSCESNPMSKRGLHPAPLCL